MPRASAWERLGLFGEDGADGFAVVEVQHAAGDLLIGLVPLAGDEHRVARPRFTQRGANRERPVGFDEVRLVQVHPRQDFRDDRLRFLVARIVAGDDGQVGEFGDRGAHARTLAAVAVAAAAEHADEPAGRVLAQGLEHVAQGVLRVGIIHEDMPAMRVRDAFEPPRHGGHFRQGGGHGGGFRAQRAADGDGGQRIHHVEPPGESGFHAYLAPRCDGPERRRGFRQPDVRRAHNGVRPAAKRHEPPGQRGFRGEAAAVRIVDVHHGGRAGNRPPASYGNRDGLRSGS